MHATERVMLFRFRRASVPRGITWRSTISSWSQAGLSFKDNPVNYLGPTIVRLREFYAAVGSFLPSTFSQPGNDYLAKTWPYTFIWFSDIKLETHAFWITSQWTMSSGGWSQEKQSTRRSWECWSTSSESSSGFRSAVEYRKYCRWISCIVIVSMFC